jgi:hypothetical protein
VEEFKRKRAAAELEVTLILMVLQELVVVEPQEETQPLVKDKPEQLLIQILDITEGVLIIQGVLMIHLVVVEVLLD